MPYYESVFIARPDISSAQVDGLVELFEKAIAGGGGSIQKKEYWGLRNLAYRIKKNRKGHYMLMNIDAPADAVAEMERQMRINEDVMRHMTLRVDELEEGPSIIIQNKDRGDERPRRGPRPDRGDRPDRGPRPDSDGGDSSRNRDKGDDA
ncbi:MAG: 30S ribosomal protein S6 [Rhodospirillaceae bacterium]|nr:30S ribosomal protein S6 [Magnetovibrio sp.]MAY68517.1 30S ribosomal protein S6 [Rhodospirillaceae bacterium]